MAYPIGGAVASAVAAYQQRRAKPIPKPGVPSARDDGSLVTGGEPKPRPRPVRPPAPSPASAGGVSTDDAAGGAPPAPSPAAPPKRPAWAMLRDAGVQSTGSAAGNRAAATAAGLPGYGMMDKPMPEAKPAAQPPVSLPGIPAGLPPELAGQIAQIARERGISGAAIGNGMTGIGAGGIYGGAAPGGAPPAPGMSELPSTPDPMAGGDEGVYGGMSKPLPALGGQGGGNPWEGIALASLRSRLGGLQSINGGGLQGGPAPAYGDPGFLAGRPETGHLGGAPSVAGGGTLRDPRMLRDLGQLTGRGGLGSF